MNVMDFLRGLGSSVASNNPVTMAVDTAANVADLGIAAAGYLGHKTGMLKADQLPEPLDKSGIPGSSAWLDKQMGVNDSTEATVGQLGGMFINPGKAAAKLAGGQNAAKAPKAIQDFIWKDKPLPENMWQGLDKLPRFEIPDDGAKLIAGLPDKNFRKLGQILDHPALYEQYPQLKNMMIRPMTEEVGGKNWRAARAAFSPSDNTVYINPNMSLKEIKDVLLHEVQHAIQKTEGFSRGASEVDSGHLAINILENYKNAKPADQRRIRAVIQGELGVDVTAPNARKLLAQNLYLQKEGEVEARIVQARASMTPAERADVPFPATFDYAPDEVTPVLWKDVWKQAFGHSDLPPLPDMKSGGVIPIRD